MGYDDMIPLPEKTAGDLLDRLRQMRPDTTWSMLGMPYTIKQHGREPEISHKPYVKGVIGGNEDNALVMSVDKIVNALFFYQWMQEYKEANQ